MQQQTESLTPEELKTRLRVLCREYGLPVVDAINYQWEVSVFRAYPTQQTTIAVTKPTMEKCEALFRMITDPRFDPLYPVDMIINIGFDEYDGDVAPFFAASLPQCKAIRNLRVTGDQGDERVAIRYLGFLQHVFKHVNVQELLLDFYIVNAQSEVILNEFVQLGVCESPTLRKLDSVPFFTHHTLQALGVWSTTAVNRKLQWRFVVENNLPSNVNIPFDGFDFRNIESFDVRFSVTLSEAKALSLLNAIARHADRSALRHLALDIRYNSEVRERILFVMRGLETLRLVSRYSTYPEVLPLLLGIRNCWRFRALYVQNRNAFLVPDVDQERIKAVIRWHPTFEDIYYLSGLPNDYYSFAREVLRENQRARLKITMELAFISRQRQLEFNPVFTEDENFRYMRGNLFFVQLLPREVFMYIMDYVGFNGNRMLQLYVTNSRPLPIEDEEEEED